MKASVETASHVWAWCPSDGSAGGDHGARGKLLLLVVRLGDLVFREWGLVPPPLLLQTGYS